MSTHILCGVKHITLKDARDRSGLTQFQLEELSGVERSRISRLESEDDTDVLHSTYVALDGALRKVGALKRGEMLVVGTIAKALAS